VRGRITILTPPGMGMISKSLNWHFTLEAVMPLNID